MEDLKAASGDWSACGRRGSSAGRLTLSLSPLTRITCLIMPRVRVRGPFGSAGDARTQRLQLRARHIMTRPTVTVLVRLLSRSSPRACCDCCEYRCAKLTVSYRVGKFALLVVLHLGNMMCTQSIRTDGRRCMYVQHVGQFGHCQYCIVTAPLKAAE